MKKASKTAETILNFKAKPATGPNGLSITPPAYNIEHPDSVATMQMKADLSTGGLLGKSIPNHTGLPDGLKNGVESLSGFSMDDVRGHNNSSKPAQLQELASAQGTSIHPDGSGQHLLHKAWHITQQQQGLGQTKIQTPNGQLEHDSACNCSGCSNRLNFKESQTTPVIQRVKIYGGQKNAIIDTDTASRKQLLDTLRRREQYKLKKTEIINIKKTLEKFNPFPGIDVKSVSYTNTMKNRILTDGKRNQKMGQKFERNKSLPDGINRLTNTASMDIAKINKFTAMMNNGQIRMIPRVIGNDLKEIAILICPYCMEPTPIESTDLDHLIATEHLKQHLLEIAAGLDVEEYRLLITKWMEEMKVNFSDWFKKAKSGNGYNATAQAMKVLHNNEGNLLLTCKTCNQGIKNNNDFKKFGEANPWIGKSFFKKNPPLPGNKYLSNQSKKPIGDIVSEFQTENFGDLQEDLFDIEITSTKQKNNSKQIALGKKTKKKSLDTQKRRLSFTKTVTDLSSDDEDDFDFMQRVAAKQGFKLIGEEEFRATKKKLKNKTEKFNKKRKQLKRKREEIEDQEQLNGELNDEVLKYKKLFEEEKKKREKLEKEIKRQDAPHHSNKKRKIEKQQLSNRIMRLCSQLDEHNSEVDGTSQSRITYTGTDFFSYEAFENAYIQQAHDVWKKTYFQTISFDQYKLGKSNWWKGVQRILRQIYEDQ